MQSLERLPHAIGIPPIPTLRAMIARSPADKDGAGYKADCEWFSRHADRAITIRTCIDEFSEHVVFLSENAPPVLHVLVVQAAQGYHVIIPIYRGNAPWRVEGAYAAVPNDGSIHLLIEHCVQNNGMDVLALIAYKNHIDTATKAGKLLASMPPQNGRPIN